MKKVLAVAVVVALLIGVRFLFQEGVTVTVRNVGSEPMIGVVVHVTGNFYAIGDIASGESKVVKVKPRGDSHIELEHQGHPRLVLDCYFETGYNGSITAEVTVSKVVSIDNAVKIGYL